jgi:hypothetical protein
VVASPRQARALLAAVEVISPELTAFYGCLYYACMRPGEAVFLSDSDCASLPQAGWGLLLTGNAPRVGSPGGHGVAVVPRVYAGHSRPAPDRIRADQGFYVLRTPVPPSQLDAPGVLTASVVA